LHATCRFRAIGFREKNWQTCRVGRGTPRPTRPRRYFLGEETGVRGSDATLRYATGHFATLPCLVMPCAIAECDVGRGARFPGTKLVVFPGESRFVWRSICRERRRSEPLRNRPAGEAFLKCNLAGCVGACKPSPKVRSRSATSTPPPHSRPIAPGHTGGRGEYRFVARNGNSRRLRLNSVISPLFFIIRPVSCPVRVSRTGRETRPTNNANPTIKL